MGPLHADHFSWRSLILRQATVTPPNLRQLNLCAGTKITVLRLGFSENWNHEVSVFQYLVFSYALHRTPRPHGQPHDGRLPGHGHRRLRSGLRTGLLGGLRSQLGGWFLRLFLPAHRTRTEAGRQIWAAALHMAV